MKHAKPDDMGKRLAALKRRCPWLASLITHCLRTRNPQAFEAMRVILARLRIAGV